MKPDIHPKYQPCKIECACGAVYETRSTSPNYKIAICAVCHPAYTGDGSQRVIFAAGQIEKFNRRYSRSRES
jgi:large subunit ribosomal protein L31